VDNIPGGIAHNGGRLRFGPDGKLYIGTGETFQAELAQDMSSLGGKILRVNADGSVPSDNPFSARPLPTSMIYAYGIRNTQGFDWIDNSTMIMVDHGPSGELGRSGHDEVNIVSAGQNLGWPTIYACQARANLISPLITWVNAQAPAGLAIYRGSRLEGWQGDAVIGLLRGGHLHRVKTSVSGRNLSLVTHESYFSGTPGESTGTTRFGRLREVISGPDGELYVTTSNCDGRGRCPAARDMILKLVPR
jgi:glucose/arabinose dehydrogenase